MSPKSERKDAKTPRKLVIPFLGVLASLRSFVILFVITLALSHTSQAANISIDVNSKLQDAIAKAAPGDTIILADGVYTGGANFDGKNDITVSAVNVGKAILEAGQLLGGTNVTLKGVVVQKVVTGIGVGAVVVGSGWRLEDVVIQDNETIGLDIHEANNF